MNELLVTRVDPLKQLNDLKQQAGGQKEATEANFSDLLGQALKEVSHLQTVSDEHIAKITSGDIKDVHSAMIAMQKADLSFQLMMQVRNKLVEAYREVMRMQV